MEGGGWSMEGGGWRVKKKLVGRKILSVMKLEGENWSVEGGGWSVEGGGWRVVWSLTRQFLPGNIIAVFFHVSSQKNPF